MLMCNTILCFYDVIRYMPVSKRWDCLPGYSWHGRFVSARFGVRCRAFQTRKDLGKVTPYEYSLNACLPLRASDVNADRAVWFG